MERERRKRKKKRIWNSFAAGLLLFVVLTLTIGMRTGEQAPVKEQTQDTPLSEQAPAEPQETKKSASEAKEQEASVSALDRMLEEMPLRQKVGQLFIVRPEALCTAGGADEESGGAGAEAATELTEEMIRGLEEYPVGGIALFSKNIVSPEQVTVFTEALQKASEIPLFLSIDEEGGQIARLANHPAFDLPRYESAAAVGAGEDPDAALQMGRTIGAYLRQYGFTMDFAPDADVNTNPENPVIGTRSFSPDAETAARMAGAMAEGLREEGILPVFKHFPGHGDTAEDSHKGIVISSKTPEEMRSCEWLPFQQAKEGDCVMVGHIAVPEICGDLTPATMAPAVVTGILREELGFQGLVITDSLEMGAVAESYDPGEAAVAAILAGCDVVLMPTDLGAAFDAVTAAVETGTISGERLTKSVRRILEYKGYGAKGYGEGYGAEENGS